MEIDYALAWDFLDDHDTRPYQLRFRLKDHFRRDGQLVAVVARADHPDQGHTLAISRAGVDFDIVEKALHGWQTWARFTENTVSLAAIRRRITDAGLA
ncbi:MAG: hypothetical protein K2X52_21745 [Mycobacteriaceae bacterium]|nr:hypothetical protein [Mycobacteriaceae bacterium]